MAVHMAVAGDVFDGVLFCAVLFPRDVLDEIRTELSHFLNFPTYPIVHTLETTVLIQSSGNLFQTLFFQTKFKIELFK